MKKKIGVIIATISFFLLIGTVGGYEQDLISTQRFLFQTGALILLLVGAMRMGGEYEDWES